ncbi:hypothetical protein V8D89_006848 [Ganoderma adspersum]
MIVQGKTVTGAGPRPRSLGVRTPYSALSGTQRTRQRKARASQYIISNAETLQSNFTLFAIVLPLVPLAAPLGESLGVRGASLADRVLSPAHRMITPSPAAQTVRESGNSCTATAPERGYSKLLAQVSEGGAERSQESPQNPEPGWRQSLCRNQNHCPGRRAPGPAGSRRCMIFTGHGAKGSPERYHCLSARLPGVTDMAIRTFCRRRLWRGFASAPRVHAWCASDGTGTLVEAWRGAQGPANRNASSLPPA